MSITGGGAGGGAAADAALRRFFLGAGPGGSVIVGIICGDLNSGGVPPIGILGNQSKNDVVKNLYNKRIVFLYNWQKEIQFLVFECIQTQFPCCTALKTTR